MSETTTITMMAPENISETNDNSKFSKSNYHEVKIIRNFKNYKKIESSVFYF
jgi:hypothetical protein